METKVCTKCGIEKPLTEFVKNSTKPGGYASECKQCKHNRYITYYKEHKDQFRKRSKRYLQKIKDFIAEKKSNGCILCGENDIVCLDFHHINGKDFTIGKQINNVSFDKIKEEVSKCVVLCANCHRKVHHHNLNIALVGSIPTRATTELESIS